MRKSPRREASPAKSLSMWARGSSHLPLKEAIEGSNPFIDAKFHLVKFD